MPTYCNDCGSRYLDTEMGECAHCGSYSRSEGAVRPIRFAALPKQQRLPWPWSALPWPAPLLILLSGEKGSGKSTLAGQLRPDIWLTTEQAPTAAAWLLKRLQGAKYRAPVIAKIDHPHEIAGHLGGLKAGALVVLDSITELGLDEGPVVLRQLQEWAEAHRGRVVVISQVTKEKRAAGREVLPHLVDVVCEVKADLYGLRRLSVVKNRHGSLFAAYFGIGAKGVERPKFTDAAFSVEGQPGDYRLTPFPTDGAQWDGPIRVADRGIEGKACAARRAKGYKSGWLIPPDVAMRKAFAVEHGLAWMDPPPQ